MLQELHIKDFAIIDDLRITFDSGLNILTGETGAGKSIIIDAVNLLLGDNVSQDVIRSEREEAVLECLFDISARQEIKDILDELGAEVDNDTLLVIKRVISRKGKNRAYINGGFATISMLRSVGERLIDIYGQHDHQSLIKPGSHVDILDSYSGLWSIRKEIKNRYRKFVSIQKELDKLNSGAEEKAMKSEVLSYQLQEINDLNMEAGEDKSLLKEKERLKLSEKIIEVANKGVDTIYSSKGSVLEILAEVVEGLKEVSEVDESLKKDLESIESIQFQLEDIALNLRNYTKTDVNLGGLESIEERLSLIAKLKRKHGKEDIKGLLELAGEIEEELASLSEVDERRAELKEEISSMEDSLHSLSNELSQKRKAVSKRLQEGVEEELSQLGMKKAIFEVRIEDKPLGEKGIDAVEFYISTNIGEEGKPLYKIASGGELSRIMLALKLVAKTKGVPTLIFDEIDAGIGGRVAEGVGSRLRRVSMSHQVFCITHLPQIACCGMVHYHVFKEEIDGRTTTRVKRLDGDEKIEEVSRMLGGRKITQKTKEHAKEMLRSAM